MSGSVGLNAPSYMPTLFGSGSQGNSLLATLSSYSRQSATAAAPAPGVNGDTADQVAPAAASPQVQRDIAQFTRAVATAKTPADLLANPVALKVLLTANGLGDQAGHTSLATRALLADASRSDSLVNQLPDTRWLSLNKAYAFATKGLTVVSDPAAIGKIANGYAEVQWRDSLEQTTPGLSTALDFQRRAAAITNVDQVLGDPTFRAVVTTVLGAAATRTSQSSPPDSAAQRQAISTSLDLTRFQDPAFVSRFAERYLAATRQVATRTTGSATPSRTAEAARSAGLVV
jgi:hypothetical protein